MNNIVDKPRYSLAEAKAVELVSHYSAPPIPVLEIAEQNGVDVVFSDFGKHKDTVSGFCDFNSAKLYVNKDEPMNRQTFTIAHELGHWMLHKELFVNDPDRYPVLLRSGTGDNSDPLEIEANHFAANILVPQKLLKPVKDAANPAKLADIFKVSRIMMEIRLKNV